MDTVHTGKKCFIDQEMRLYNGPGGQSVAITGTIIAKTEGRFSALPNHTLKMCSCTSHIV